MEHPSRQQWWFMGNNTGAPRLDYSVNLTALVICEIDAAVLYNTMTLCLTREF